MLTQWIQKIISMLLVMSAVLQVIPGKDYEKYIRFFCGLVHESLLRKKFSYPTLNKHVIMNYYRKRFSREITLGGKYYERRYI